MEYASGKRSLRAYIAVCLQIHFNPSSYYCQFAGSAKGDSTTCSIQLYRRIQYIRTEKAIASSYLTTLTMLHRS